MYVTVYAVHVCFSSVTDRPHYSMSLVLVASLPAVEELDKSQYVKGMPGVIALTPKYMTSRHHSVASEAGFQPLCAYFCNF